MKIKAVCEATGLTDRAVRYYIDEGLISPAYTENYLGRRNYDFCEEDVRALERIAKLRSYDFSVAEIGGMLCSPETIGQVCGDLIARKRAKLKEDERILAALEKLPELKPGSVEELVEALEKPESPVPPERVKTKLLPAIGKAVMAALVFAPFALAALMWVLRLIEFRFVKFDLKFCLIMLACLVPSVLALMLPKRIPSLKWRAALRVLLAVLCAISVFAIFSFGMLYWNSGGTDKLSDYGVPDWASGWPSGYEIFEALFPAREEFFGEGSEPVLYHYLNIDDFDGGMAEIYAERRIDAVQFEREVELRKLAFAEYYEQHAEDWRVYWGGYGPEGSIALKYKEFSHGRFSCCAFYTESEPFSRDTRGTVYLFASDPETLTLRYVYCSASASFYETFYCGLDW